MRKLNPFFVLLMSMIGLEGAAKSVAPFPTNANDPLSSYLLVDNLPTASPITHMVTFENQLLIGCENGIYIRLPDGSWHHSLRFAVYDDFFVSGAYLWALVDKSRAKTAQGDLWWYMSEDGISWKEVAKPKLHEVLDYDSKHDIAYVASKNQYNNTQLFIINQGEATSRHNPLLDRLNALSVQSSSGHLLVGTGNGLLLSKDNGIFFIDLSRILGMKQRSDYQFTFLVNDRYMVVEVSSRIFISKNGGVAWTELTKGEILQAPKGQYRLNRIKALEGHRLIVRQEGRYFLFDLETDKATEFKLPNYYWYKAFAIVGDDVYASAYVPNEGIIKQVGRAIDGNVRNLRTPLLKIHLKPVAACTEAKGNQPPVTLVPHIYKRYGMVVDSMSVYVNDGNSIQDIQTGKAVSDERIISEEFTKGSKCYWYVKSALVRDASGKQFNRYPLMRSKDKGKNWQPVQTRVTVPHTAIIDDSLSIAYAHTTNVVLRYDLNGGGMSQSHPDEIEGTILKLHIDERSRLWVLTTYRLYVSLPKGFESIPLPFKTNELINITGFAHMGDAIVINYDDKLYISQIDTIDWLRYAFCDPCNDDEAMRLRIVGNSNELLVLQEQTQGHIWLLDPSTDKKQRMFFPRNNGLIRQVYVTENRLLVQTTGIPLTKNSEDHKHTEASPLFQYHIHLKNLRNYE